MSEDFIISRESVRKPKISKKKRIIVNVIISVVLAISLFFDAGALVLMLRPTEEPGGSKQEMENVVKSENKDVTYFLVVGTDESSALTDIMMVVCFDHGAKKINILQVPRDTYIGSDIPTGKINAVYGSADQGESRINVLMQRINTHLGLPIDHYVTVSISAFRKVVDAVGGVDVYIPQDMVAYDSKAAAYYFNEGVNHLDGGEAEAFIRYRRGYAMGDLGRVEAQRNFYAAFLKAVMDMSYGEMASVATKCYNDFNTSMAVGTIIGYAQQIQKMDMNAISIYSVPGQSGTFSPNGQALSYYSIHKQEYVDLINEHFLPYERYEKVTQDLQINELHSTYYDGVLDNDDSHLEDYITGNQD